MRAFIDPNVFISYLLHPTAGSPPAVVVRAGLVRASTVLFSQAVLTEVRSKIADKPYLASRIAMGDVADFAALLVAVAQFVPEIPESLPAVGRDRKDDYLFAHALIGRADYLVSGDDDVLRIGQIDELRTVSPAQFVEILRQSGLI